MKQMKRFLAFILAVCMIAASVPVSGYTVKAEEKQVTTSGTVIDVTDYGADPSGATDSAVAIQKAIEAAKEAEGPVTISFPKGRYDIYPDKAAKRELYLSNTMGADQNQYKIKTIGILLEDMKDVTVEGNGSLFMFHGKMMTFASIRCENVTFQNFEVNFQVPTVVDITVEKVEGNTATVYVPECYNYEIEGTSVKWLSDVSPYTGKPYWTSANGMQYNLTYDAAEGRTRHGGTPVFSNVTSIEEIGNHRLKFTYSSVPAMKAGIAYQMRETYRDHSAAFFWESKNVTVQHLDVRYVHGLAMLGQFSENITFKDVTFEAEESSGRISAGFCDFIHMSGCKGLIDVSECRFTNAHDDPINIHGTFLQVKERIASNKFKVEFRHHQTGGFPQFYVGDEVEFVTSGNMIPVKNSVAKVTEVQGPTGDAGAEQSGSGSLTEIIITLDKDMPEEIQAGTHVVENITYTPSVSIKGNEFMGSSTRGVLVTTRKPVVIEDNIFDGMGMAGIYISNDAQGWYESGPSRDVLIKNNVFTRGRTDAIWIDPTNPTVSTEDTVHDNIRIIGNKFYPDNTKVLNAKSVSNLQFKDNVIYRPEAMKDAALSVENGKADLEVGATAVLNTTVNAAEYGNKLFNFNGCRNVLIRGNKYDGGLNAGSSIWNMSVSDITVEDDIMKVNADSKTDPYGKITYKSSDENVLKVSANGVVTAVGEGTASVSASYIVGGRKFETNEVTFTVAGGTLGLLPTGVTITAPTEVANTEPVQYTAEVTGETGVNDNVKWSVVDAESGNSTDKAVIDENGLLTPQKSGVVEIVATTVNGLEARKLLSIQSGGYELSDDYEVLFPYSDTMEISGEDEITLKSCGQGLWAGMKGTSNIVLTDKGAENVTATVKLNGKTKTGYEYTGLIFYKDNDNYVSVERKHAAGNPKIMVTTEAQGNPTEEGLSDVASEEIYFKLEKTGNTIKGYYSTDETTWTEVRAVENAQLGSDFKIGLSIGCGDLVSDDGVPNGPMNPYTYSELKVDGVYVPFTKRTGVELSDDYEVLFPNQETMQISGEDQITLLSHNMGLWATQTTNNIVVTDKGAENVTATVKISGVPTTGWDYAGFIFYKDNDNYVSIERKNQEGGVLRVTTEANRNPSEEGLMDPKNQDLYLKLEKTGNTVKGYYSTDENTWTLVREVTNDQLGSDFKIGLVTGCGVGSNKTPFIFSELKVDGVHVPFTKPASAPTVEAVNLVYTEAENKLEAEYQVPEGVSVLVKWAAADTADGAYTVLEGMTGNTVTASAAMKGKFIRAAVIPVNAAGVPGKITWTNAVELTGESDKGEENLKSANAWLKTAEIAGVTFDAFNTKNLYYFTTASADQKTVSFDFKAADDKAAVKTVVNGQTVENQSSDIKLHSGINEIEVTVTAEDQVTQRYYRFVVSRTEETNTALRELSIDNTEIALADGIYAYEYQAGNVEEAVIKAAAEDEKSTVTISLNGEISADGRVALVPGKNKAVILVTPVTSAAPARYVLNIKVPKADNANLETIEFNENVTLDAEFDAETAEYTGLATGAKVKFNAVTEEADAKIQVTVNGEFVDEMRGTYRGTLKMSEGENIVVVKTVSPDGTAAKEYTFRLEGSSVIYLSDLDWESNSTNGWQDLQKDVEVGGSLPISLKDEADKTVTFKKGIGAHANSDVYYDLEGKGYTKFETYAGVDASQGGRGTVQFEVLIDGVSKYVTDTLTSSSPMQKISLEIPADAKMLQLKASIVENDYNDHADWADAKFFTKFEGEAIPEGTYVVTVDGKEVARGQYNDKITLPAPEVPEEQKFAGWETDGKIVSVEESYQFYLSNDIDFITRYVAAAEDVEADARALLANIITAKRENDGKSNVKFVGQLVVPEGYELLEAGLVWSSNDTAELGIGKGAKETYIRTISDTNQFSVTIKGVPQGRFVRGKIFAKIKDDQNNIRYVYSEEHKAFAK